MRVYRDFFTYRGGIYRRSAASRDEKSGFHSVRLVGWGEERTGYEITKFWVSNTNRQLNQQMMLICI